MYISSVVSKRTANALLKKNIYTTDDFVRFFPKNIMISQHCMIFKALRMT